MTTPGLSDGTRLRITGSATPEEIAAVVVALDVALQRPAHGRARRGGWLEAARREGTGEALVRSRADLAAAVAVHVGSA